MYAGTTHDEIFEESFCPSHFLRKGFLAQFIEFIDVFLLAVADDRKVA